MTTVSDAQLEAKKIWDQLDSDEASGTVFESEDRTEATDTETAPAASDRDSAQQSAPQEEDDVATLRQKLAGMEAMVNQLGGRLRNAEGHIGGLNSQVKQQLEAAKTVAAAGVDAPSAREIRAAQDSPEALAQIERDYPEFAKALRPAIEATLKDRFAELERRLPQGHSPQSDVAQEMQTFRAEMRVEARHPGWQETVKTSDFMGWMQNSPRELKLLAGSNEPADAVRLLDMYAESKKVVTNQRNQRLESAAAMPTGQRSTARTKNVDDMTPQEYWRYLDNLDKQKA